MNQYFNTNHCSTSSPGTGSYHHQMQVSPGTNSVMGPPPGWFCGASDRQASAMASFPADDESSSSICGLERASKRLRLASPPRPSMCAKRFFNSSRSSSSSSLDEQQDPAMPPSIQRLALPSLLHAGGDLQPNHRHHHHHHGNASHHQRQYSSDSSSPCPFGTML